MTVSISNMAQVWMSNTNTYNAIAMSVSTMGYGASANSSLLSFKVDGSNRFKLDVNGRPSIPNLPMISAQHLTTISYSANQLIQFSSVYDPMSMFSGAPNYRTVVPVAGRYMISVDLLTNSTASTDIGVYIRKSGSIQRRIYTSITSGTFRPFSGTIILNCVVGDYIDFISQLNTSVIYGGDIGGFTMYLLG